uniref:Armadillo repeat containing 5 n=1 Tax=Echeneis naucrates TaxID=173247 RepID=A0A665T168_ECHNA
MTLKPQTLTVKVICLSIVEFNNLSVAPMRYFTSSKTMTKTTSPTPLGSLKTFPDAEIMAATPVQGDWKQTRAASREGHPSSPETSLTWCLAHLSKPGPGAEHPGPGRADSGGSREMDKRSRVSQWRALVAIRTQHIKGDKAGIARFRTQGGLRPLLDLIKHPECSRKTLDLALSILANCCTEPETRIEVKKKKMKTVQNRAARALGNLAMDPESSALIHSLSTQLTTSCSFIIIIIFPYRWYSPPPPLCTLSALAPLIAPEYPQGLRRAALRTLHELTRGCGVECAREVSRSGVLAQLGVMASGESGKPFEELALKTLANMCSQGCLRPLVGSLGVIQKFAEEVKRDLLKSGVFLKALCLCCKEAVNRAKVKESGGLEVLTGFLSTHQSHPLSRLAILACVDFVFDESAMEQLQELGLVPLLVERLVELTRGEDQSAEKMDVNIISNMSPTELILCSSSFQSLRSWLVSEGLISSEGELLDSSGVEGEWGSLQIPPSSSPQTSSPNPYSSSLKTACLTKVTLDAPPSVPRQMAYHHPYHPEPWTPESPILLLLSRFSHATDPSAALVSSGVMSGLLYYLTQHKDPSSRCFRMLCRLSCNPNCLQALVRTGSVALIRHHLCQREGGLEGEERQTERVRGKLHSRHQFIICESGFGAGVLAHVMLSGSESDKVNCALSLPLISSNKSLLKKLLLDSGGLLLALQPLGFLKESVSESAQVLPPPSKKPRLADVCPYGLSNFDLHLLLDDGTRLPANREAVAGAERTDGISSEYFRALLKGGFGEAQGSAEEAIHIKDVSTGVLLPVLHYLHGCRLTKDTETRDRDEGDRGGRCQILDSLVLAGLSICQRETEENGFIPVRVHGVHSRLELAGPLSGQWSRTHRAGRWCEGCETESGFHRPRETSGRRYVDVFVK